MGIKYFEKDRYANRNVDSFTFSAGENVIIFVYLHAHTNLFGKLMFVSAVITQNVSLRHSNYLHY